MAYRITSVSGSMIYIQYEDYGEIDGALELLESIAGEADGKVVMVGPHNNMFEIEKDPLRLRYQWDARYGVSVTVGAAADMPAAVGLLERHMKKMNDK